ncbi:uncharacterized protein PHACADRAFT_208126 [Phanerochaete carnosa HHB-10118-sp]|uniref:F-box domain-containing protein n=1 Tax=Phanerochaete carnosa (strain HHB-10118-sp) TaxID=650164 RepID=K5X2E0_PHACS|nr:uncharacterized protein PHACADRAFT_208126 [Phanerochaete carnosa HHB-10118-sp]EKM56957.1 hypothetical protein PHACADRAFT_208126 [Phanerochaete carnosa HHB-10118-sp]
MDRFSALPVDLLPNILQEIIPPNHLASVCLVNSTFHAFGVQFLYRRIFIYSWHKEAKVKVRQLLRTLANCPHLAKHVVQLTLRDFPRAMIASTEREQLMTLSLQAIRSCVNLRSCTLTRDGSLSNDIILTLQQAQHLAELEINGHNFFYFKPGLLPDFKHLRKISLIMPSPEVLNILSIWVQNTAPTLQHLTLLCQSSNAVTDELLETLSEYMVNLEYLYLVGCPKVTHVGVWAIISKSEVGLRGLGLEDVSPSFDIHRLSELCAVSQSLRRLKSITLTVESRSSTSQSPWTWGVTSLLAASPLEFFHVSSLGGDLKAAGLDDRFCHNIVAAHGERLRRFSVHRLRMSLDAVRDICARCPKLEQLFVVLDRTDLNELGLCLSVAKSLRAVHVNRPIGPESDSESIPVVPRELVLSILRQSGLPALKQIGFNTRVNQVERLPRVNENGEVEMELQLGPYESPEIPEQFLVVRTS